MNTHKHTICSTGGHFYAICSICGQRGRKRYTKESAIETLYMVPCDPTMKIVELLQKEGFYIGKNKVVDEVRYLWVSGVRVSIGGKVFGDAAFNYCIDYKGNSYMDNDKCYTGNFRELCFGIHSYLATVTSPEPFPDTYLS